MRHMSFALTEPQLFDRSKTVTRRLGWAVLVPGMLVQPVRKSMGLRKGERVHRICSAVTVAGARREPLRLMTDDEAYGRAEVVLEGFPDLTPRQFVEMFCDTHKRCTPETVVTRIEFRYG
jgi:hypothetical protein